LKKDYQLRSHACGSDAALDWWCFLRALELSDRDCI